MIIESAISLIGGGLAWMYLDGKDKRKIRRSWNETLMNCKFDGVRLSKKINNKTVYKTYMLNKIYPKPYGWLGACNIPKGLTFTALEKAKECLEDTFGAKIELEKKIDDKKGTYAQIKCMIKDMCKVDFKPYKTKPYELLLGLELDGCPYKMNLNKDTHLLIIGANGTGKSYLLASILTNLFYNNKNDFEIWGMQNKKNDLDTFSNLFKTLSKSIDEILASLKRIEKICNDRNEKFSKEDGGGIRDITQYNELHPEKPLKRILVVIEEIFFMMPQPYDSEEMQNDKKQCLSYFMSIVKAGRSCGCHFIATTQRATIQNLPSDVKQECTKIALHMKSETNSENAIDIPDARYLKERQFIFDGNLEVTTLTVPLIDKHFKLLNSFVPEIKVPNLNTTKEKEEKTKPPITKSTQPTKYTSETSQQIPMTPEEYYHKTGYMPYELRKKMGIIEIKIDEKAKENIVQDVKPQEKPSNNKNQSNGKVTSSRGGYKQKSRW